MFKNLVLQMHRELIPSGGGSTSTEQEPQQGSELETPPNPNPEPPPAPPTDSEYVRQLQDSIRKNEELVQRNTELMSRLEQRLATPTPTAPTPAPIPQSAEEINKEYYESPGTFVTKRIEQALERTVKPLNEFVSNYRSTEQIDNLIREVKGNAKIASQWDSAVEDVVRKQLASVPASSLNFGLAQQAAVNAIGLKTLGAFGTSAPSTPAPTPNQETPVSTPPNIRPSNPPAPNSRPAKKTIELNENERRLAREQRQTPEEFVFWRDMPADKVMTAKWDKTKNEGTY